MHENISRCVNSLIYSRPISIIFFSALVEYTEADEALADQALLGGVFLFLTEGILGSDGFSQEEFYTRRLHSLITDFLALMPMKV